MPYSHLRLCRFIICCLVLLSSPSLQAKKAFYWFDNQPTQQGLSNSWVNKVLQGPHGYIWVGSQNGLFRYDGNQYKAFFHDAEDPTSLGGGYINNLYLDSQGELWLSFAHEGFAQYHPQTESFTNYRHDPQNPNSLSNNEVTAIVEDQAGDLWIATRGGLNQYNRQTRTFTHYSHNPKDANSLSGNGLYSLLIDSQGILWIGTRDNGLNRFDRQTGRFSHYHHQPEQPNSLSHNRVLSLFEDAEQTLWIGTQGGGLNRFDRQTESFQRFEHNPDDPHSLSSNQVYDIATDKLGSLWIGTRFGGLNRFDPINQRFYRYSHHPENPDSLIDNDVYSISVGQDGLLWLGTFGGGLSKFNPDIERFGLMQHDASNPNSLNKNDVRAIFKDPAGPVWIGTDQGLNRYDESTDRFTFFRHDPNDPHSLSHNDVRAILVDTTGTLWVGTTQGLNRWDDKAEHFIHYRHQTGQVGSLSDDEINALHQDSLGQLWVGTTLGLNRFNAETKTFSHFFHDAKAEHSLSHDEINTLYTTDDGSLWVGTDNGLNHFNQQQQIFTRYFNNPNNINSLSHNRVYSISQDEHQILWIATKGGLNKLDLSSQTFSHYSEKNGLQSNRVQAVLSDKNGHLWLGELGISRFNLNTGRIKTNVGTQGNCHGAAFGAYHRAADGQLFFGGNYGFCAFYPENIVRASQPPTIVFTDFRLLNKSVPISTADAPTPLTQAINHTEWLTLEHKDNVLSFEFAALHYAAPWHNQYKYKLSGFNPDWIETSVTNRRASYTNLSPGDYRFMVKASNNEGVWTEQARTIGLTILPAPWRTWWAYTLYVLLIFGIIGSFSYQWFTKRQAIEQRQKLLEAEKMAALGNLVSGVAHEVNTPLGICITMVSLHQERLQTLLQQKTAGTMTRKSLDDYIEATTQSQTLVENSLHRAAELIQSFKKVAVEQTADSFDEIVFHDYLGDIITSIEPRLTRLTNQKITIELLSKGHWSIRTYPGAWWQLLSNLVENSLSHGFSDQSSGEITIYAERKGHCLFFTYSDNGNGMSAEALKKMYEPFFTTTRGRGDTGLGMHIVFNLVVQKLGGDINCQSEPGKGVVFVIEIPV